MINLPRLPLAVMALLAATPAEAQAGYADLGAIDREVVAFTGAGVGSEGGATSPVDRRLRLASCGAPLALSWRTARHDTVLVQCPDAGSWRIFVPVRAAGGGAIMVEKGEAVTIAVAGDGFSVSQPGEALDAGAVGEWVRVRAVKENGFRSDAIRARIVRPGQVEVPLP